jgi:Ca2+-binding RTX toxin-like protein
MSAGRESPRLNEIEGASESTHDLDGIRQFQLDLPSGATLQHFVRVNTDDEGGDDATVWLNICFPKVSGHRQTQRNRPKLWRGRSECGLWRTNNVEQNAVSNPTTAIVGTNGDDLSLVSFENGNASYMLGLDGNDRLLTNNGNDVVFGGDGFDTIFAGTGTDFYSGGGNKSPVSLTSYNPNAPGDFMSFEFSFVNGFRAGETRSVNTSAVSFDLSKKGIQNVGGAFGADHYEGFDSVAGGAGADILLGSNGRNTIYGGAGNDTISGRGGADSIFAGEGADKITGGTGGDVIVLGGETLTTYDGGPSSPSDEASRRKDIVIYNAVNESPGRISKTGDLAAVDIIISFDSGGLATDDRISLSSIDANPFSAGNQAFRFVKTLSATGVGEIAVKSWILDGVVQAGYWEVLVDTDRDATAEMSMIVTTFEDIKLIAADFIL